MAPWDPNDTVHIDEVYTRLSWCREDKHPRGIQQVELSDYSEIFSPHNNAIPKRILVKGQGGIGKSTFVQKLAVDWARGEKEALKKFDLLLVIKLRDVGGIRNFKEMLVASGIVQSEECAQVESFVQYINEHQDRVLILFDGYDEYDRELARDVTSDVHKIITGKMLIGCYVVVTTRQSRVDEVKKFMQTQCKVNGFTQEDIETFVSKYVGRDEIRPFLDYLNKQTIMDMAEIPLLLLFLCLLWKERKAEPLPTSRTQLYQEFVQCILDHCYAKVSPDNLKNVEECSETLCKIGKVAFEALLQDSLVFDSAQLPSEVLNDEVVRLGFLSTSKVQHRRSKVMTSFLHKSMQEFLAAWYIAKEVIPSGNTEWLSCIDFASVGVLYDFLVFVCGLSTECAVSIFRHLETIGNKESVLPCSHNQFACLMEFTEGQKDFLRLCFNLFFEMDSKDVVSGAYLDCVHGVVWSEYYGNLLFSETDAPLLLRHDNLVQLLICLPHYEQRESMKSLFSSLDQMGVRMGITHGVPCLTVAEFIQEYNLTGFTGESSFWLVKRASTFYLCFNELYIENPSSCSSPSTDQSWSEVCFPEHQNNQDLTKQGKCDDSTCSPPMHFLSLTTKVDVWQHLDRANNSLVDFFHQLSSATNLHHLVLHGIGLSSEEVAALAVTLDHLSSLETLDVSYNPLGRDICVLLEHLYSLPSLVKLNLQGTEMGERELRALAMELKNVPRLEKLILGQNPLVAGVSALAYCLPSVPKLTLLDLQETGVTEREASDVAEALQHVPQLEWLILSSNPHIGWGLISLANKLIHVPKLVTLLLVDTGMDSKCKAALEIAQRSRRRRIPRFVVSSWDADEKGQFLYTVLLIKFS